MKNKYHLIISKTSSLIGTQIFSIFLNLWIVSNYKNAIMLPLSLSITSVITLIFSLFGGAASASYNVKKILQILDIISAMLCGVGMLICWVKDTNHYFVYIALTITNSFLSLTSSFSGPIFKKMTGIIVKKTEILDYNEMLSASKEIVQLIIPSVTSFLFSLNLINVYIALGINALSFFISFISISGIKNFNHVRKGVPTKVWSNYVDSMKEITKTQTSFENFLNIFFLYICASGLNILMPIYTVHTLSSSSMYGILESFQALGAAISIGTFKLWPVDPSLKKERKGIIITALVLLLTPFVNPKITLSLSMFILSFFYLRYNVAFQTFMQLNFPNRILGHVYSLFYIVTAISTLLGNALVGWLSDVNVNFCLMVISLIMIITNLPVLLERRC